MSDPSYEQGVFCWIDLSAPDLDAAMRWYADMFGWTMTPPDPAMPYSMAMLDGKMIAGIGPMQDDMKAAGAPPMWNSYVWVDDCAAVEAKARDAGAKILAPTMQIGEFGTMAVIQDPGGAALGLWQPGTHRGAGRFEAPNSLCWNELMTRDVAASKAFYAEVFGWEYGVSPMGDFDYTLAKVGARETAGMMPMVGEEWGETPAHWMVYFAVADIDATAERCAAIGGKVCVPPTQIPIGRFAVLEDPHGATFSVIQLDTPA